MNGVGEMRLRSLDSDTATMPEQAADLPPKPRSFTETAGYKAFYPILICARLTGLIFIRIPRCQRQPGNTRRNRAELIAQTFSTILLIIYSANLIRSCFAVRSDDGFGSFLFNQIMNICWYAWCELNAIAFYIASYRCNALPLFFSEWEEIRNDSPYCRRKATICISLAVMFIFINMVFCIYQILFSDMTDQFIIYPLDSSSEYATAVKIALIILYIFYQYCWLLPVVITYVICSALFYEFRNVNLKLAEFINSGTEDADKLMAIRQAHQKVCRLVGHADEVLKLHIAVSLIISIIVICVTLYIMIWNWSTMESITERLMFLFWFLATLVFLTIGCIGGGFVNDEAHAAFDMIHDMPLTSTDPRFSVQLTAFMSRLSGSPIGLTAFNMFVIDKPTSLTMVGMLITYFVLLIQFQPSDPPACNCACTALLPNVTNATF